MRNKKGTFLLTIGALLLLGAAGLAGYNLWDNHRAAACSAAVLEELSAAVPEPDSVLLPEGVVPDYAAAPEMMMPTVEIEENDYIGYLELPSIGISLPVLSEWNYPNLKLSPCRYAGSAYLDDLVICAHNYTGHFGRLKELPVGDTVLFTDIDGNVFTYSVTEAQQLGASDIDAMTEGDWDLSLFTCTVGGQYRYTVRCERVEDLDT